MRESAHILRTVADLEELRVQVENSLALLRSLAHQVGAYATSISNTTQSQSNPSLAGPPSIIQPPDSPTESASIIVPAPYRFPTPTPSSNRRWTDVFKAIFQARPHDWIHVHELRRCALQAGAGNLFNVAAVLSAWKRKRVVSKRGNGAKAEYKYLIREPINNDNERKEQDDQDQTTPRIVAL